MTSEGDLVEILAKAGDRDRVVLEFAALLAAESGLGDQLVVVGGSALEIYTRGGYASGDIDLVGDRAKIASVLAGWGFAKKGRYWAHGGLKLFVDIPGRYYNGNFYRTQVLTTPHGRVRISEPEYLLVRRLAAAKFWRDSGALDEAALLAAVNPSAIDWSYAEELAEREEVSDLMSELRSRVKSVVERLQGGKLQ